MADNVKITFLNTDGTTHYVQAIPGKSLMEAAVLGNVPGVEGECGGCCNCATCHVFVPDGWKGANDHEDAMLDGTATERTEASRLSCQMIVSPEMNGITIRLPENQ